MKPIHDAFLKDGSPESARFTATALLRDQDVHEGDVVTDALDTMIPGDDHGAPFDQCRPPSFGPRSVTTHTNPDGTEVSANSLRGSAGLYLILDGQRWEASKLCALHIAQLRTLMQKAKGP